MGSTVLATRSVWMRRERGSARAEEAVAARARAKRREVRRGMA
jgi:hypothetical protein